VESGKLEQRPCQLRSAANQRFDGQKIFATATNGRLSGSISERHWLDKPRQLLTQGSMNLRIPCVID
jgi:hypothetical protein